MKKVKIKPWYFFVLLAGVFFTWFFSRPKVYKYIFTYGEYGEKMIAYFLPAKIYARIIDGNNSFNRELSLSGFVLPDSLTEVNVSLYGGSEEIEKQLFSLLQYRIVEVNESQILKVLSNE